MVPRVWIVDDSAAARKSLSAVLQTAGMTVRDFEAASDVTSALPGDVCDCLVLDNQMPGKTGLELLAELRAGGSTIPVIMISARDGNELRCRCMPAGATAVLEKPVDGIDLIELIARHTP